MANQAKVAVSGGGHRALATGPVTTRKRLIAAAISACFAAAPAWANPTAPQVVNGSASFNQSGKLLTVTNGSGAIINWNTFSIAAGETTRFNQASANSSVLNRVLANDPSVLLGTLSSNGRVWLVNPAGIMVGQGARVDVAGFVASTLNVRNEDFLAGRLNFGATPNAGRIENHGQITTTSGGSVYLIAPVIENHGIINAPNGEVILAAGQTAQLVDTGTPGVKVDITGAEGNVTNLGEIVAEAGRIGMAGVLVRNSGTLNASSLVKEGGRVFLKAAKDVTLENTSQIKADSGSAGNGGVVSILADDTVRVDGGISARGGSQAGDGGFIETSGAHVKVGDGARISTLAPNGTAGNWLIDPTDYTIAAVDPLNGSSYMSNATLSANLSGGPIAIQTLAGGGGNGDIIVNGSVTWAANKLTLTAHRNINLNASLNGSGTAQLALEYGQGAVAAGNAGGYKLASGVKVYLPAGLNFSTRLGSDGVATNFTVVTGLGIEVDTTTSPGTMSLQGIAATANLNGNYVLGAEIPAAGTSTWNSNGAPTPVYAGFTPIGNYATAFTGTFDGLGHSISDLKIYRPAEDSVGLFGIVGSAGKVRNVVLTGPSVAGRHNVGGLVGWNNGGTVSGSSVAGVTGRSISSSGVSLGGMVGSNNSGSVSDSYVTNLTVSGTGTGGDIGGLVGANNSGNVISSYVSGGSVSGVNTGAGGLVGWNNGGNVSNSYVIGGTIVTGQTLGVGGLVAYNNAVSGAGGSISGSHVENATVSSSGGGGTGGLVGGTDGGVISNSYVSAVGVGSTGAVDNVGGLVGRNSNGTISGGTVTGGLVTGRNSVGGLIGNNSVGNIDGSHVLNTPVTSTGGWGDVGGLVGYNNGGAAISNSYVSFSVSGTVQGAANYVGGLVGRNENGSNLSTVSVSNTTVTGHDHHVGGLVGLNGTGTLDGGTVSNGSVTGSSWVGGLVGANYSSITNSHVLDTPVTSNLNDSYWGVVGGLAGSNDSGSISNSYVSFGSSGMIRGRFLVGGLVGENNGGQLSGVSVTNALVSSLSGGGAMGGLVGGNRGNIVTSHVTGGSVSGAGNIGGLLGGNEGGNISDSHVANITINAGTNERVGGLIGSNSTSNTATGGSISGSDVTGATITGGGNVGGLVGANTAAATGATGGAISSSFVSGSTVYGVGDSIGGLVGNNSVGNIDGSHVLNTPVTSTGGWGDVGGLVGHNLGGAAISNSYVSFSVSGTVQGAANYVGGLVGRNENGSNLSTV
ncbi:MAG: filamentous hemagglutinin N-terminal domain-containing protein, partial [Proteobacteria bacterium]|nr:filamentous hemagglutinin N-terminal domain-containing protein [Pseudomonadota bacterium]